MWARRPHGANYVLSHLGVRPTVVKGGVFPGTVLVLLKVGMKIGFHIMALIGVWIWIMDRF